MKKYVLITKDAMCTEYLPIYGNKIWNTPNLNELAAKGTVFKNHYSSAPSTVMSFYSTITGIYAHETNYEMYEQIHDVYEGSTFFTKLKDEGYECHILWGDIWMVLLKYFDCYRNDVKIHKVDDFRQGVGAHYSHNGFLKPDSNLKKQTFQMIEKEVKQILNCDRDIFLWIHFPHVINGEVAYGSDIELFDKYIGMIRSIVPDDCIAISSDHGNMNGHKGKICYGYDLYDSAIKIPLITPRIKNRSEWNTNSTNCDLYSILFKKEVPENRFIYSDTAYCAQKHRKIAIIYKNYKYIYNKIDNSEELYDLNFDPREEFSLMHDYMYDIDRKINAPSRELYYYPDWESLIEVRQLFKKERIRIWKNGSVKVIVKSQFKDWLRPFYKKIKKHFKIIKK